MSLDITPAFEPESSTWTYLVADAASKSAAIIDPVWVFNPVSSRADTEFIDQLLDHAQRSGYRVEWVLETHAHADHLSSGGYIRERTGARIAIGRGICSVQKTFARVFNLENQPLDGSPFDRLLHDGDRLPLGNLEIRVMETPGHTPDSVCYLVEDAAFIGDTLFAPTYGTARCDFPGGNAADMFDSIQRIYRLPDSTRLFLCHDYPAEGAQPACEVSVADSRKHNVHVNETTRKEAYVKLRTERDAKLGLPRLIYPAVQVNIRAGMAPQADGNGVAYLRLPFNRSIAEILEQAAAVAPAESPPQARK
jgi:glyoxylase-like metal-dependent hydrolase (beta-lactamase superfamily II)